jgi:hypothetical protein
MGVIYDASAYDRIDKFLDSQEDELKKIDKEQDQKKAIRYAILIGATIVLIIGVKILVDRNAKK